MPDSDVDEQIRTFRRKLDRELGIPEGKTFEDWLNQVFRNPTTEQPIELSEFLSHLDVRSFMKVFERIYPRFRIIKQRHNFFRTSAVRYTIKPPSMQLSVLWCTSRTPIL